MSIESTPNLRISRPAFVLASLLLAALLLFLFLPRNAGAYRAVPSQTTLLFECNGLLRVKKYCDKMTNQSWRPVLHSAVFSHCFGDADDAIRLFDHQPEILRAFVGNQALVAFSLNPADSLHALFALELAAEFDLGKALKSNPLTSKYFPHQFHGNEIFNVYLSKTDQLEVACSGRLLLFSRKATLVEDALAQLENAHNWWADRPYISDLPGNALRIQLRPAALAEQLRGQMNARWRGLPDLLARNVSWAGISWDGLEVKALAEATGFLSGMKGWGDVPDHKIFGILPQNTAFLARAGLGQVPAFFRELGKERSSDFEQYVLPWVGKETVIAVTEPLSPELAADRLLLLAVRDSAKAVNCLRAFGKEHGTVPLASGQYQMFELMGFQRSSLLQPILADDEAFRNPVCCLAGGYAIFAPDRSSLEIVLDKYLVNQTLAAHTDFLQMQEKAGAGGGSASFLLNTAYLPALLQNLLGVQGEAPFSRLGFVGLEWKPGFGRKVGLLFASQPLSQPISETDILWKTVLAAPAITQPFLVAQAQGKMLVLCQDLKFTLYCLDAQNGAVLWRKPLSERIVSEIEGIDYYGNGSKCYTFSSLSRIYTLDENGKDVEQFPLKLPDTATNATTVVDFDKNLRFSYFVACANGKVYGFGPLGKPLDGWNALSLDAGSGKVRQPILHFQHQGKDYLAVLTESGLLSVFGRDGRLRFPPVQLDNVPPESNMNGDAFGQPLQVDAAASSPRIYCSNGMGKVFACDLQGRVLEQRPGRNGSTAAFGQLTGDERFEFAVLDGKKLSISTWDKPLFITQFPEKQHTVFITHQQQLGTVDKHGRRIWLLDSDGKCLPGFPLGGNTKFETCQLNGVDMLIVGNGNSVWAYRRRK